MPAPRLSIALALAASGCRLGFDPRDGGGAGAPPAVELAFAEREELVDLVSGAPAVGFARASSATYRAPDGRLVLAGVDVPRFDHAAPSGASRGLLLEPARTNLARHGDDFFRDAVARSATVLADAARAPDGTMTADKLVETATMAFARELDLTYLSVAPGRYAHSVFARAGERRLVTIGSYQAGDQVFIGFDLVDGTSFELPGYLTPEAWGLEPYGDGWYRLWESHPSTGGGRRFDVGVLIDAQRSTYVGDGTSGVYVWGAQVEAGRAPTSYVPTGDAPITRAADVAALTPDAFRACGGPAIGALAVGFERGASPGAGEVARVARVATADGAGWIDLGVAGGAPASPRDVVEAARAGAVTARLDTGAAGAAGAHARTAVALGPGGLAAATDGGAVARGAAGAVAPDLAGLALGPGAADEAPVGGLRSLACWASPLADEALRAATE